jgi:exonuclease III
MLMLLERLRFSWWNSGLTPPTKKSRGPADCYDSFDTVLTNLIHQSDLIGLCEIGNEDHTVIEHLVGMKGWSYLSLTKKTEKKGTYFDHAILFDPSKLSVEFIDNIESSHANKTIKVSQQLKVTTKSFGHPEFNVFLSHWPSKIMDKVEERENAASSLRFTINPLLKRGERVILMGDYNESPFSTPMNIKLQSSKCYDAVISSKNSILYNPFWKLSISKKNYSHLESKPKEMSRGSYYYSPISKDLNKFLTYDQILLSGNFLGQDEWHLDERATKILVSEATSNSFNDKNIHVDHYPITIQIIRV